MALRIRMVDGMATVAVCAAKSIEKEGDVYLDDGQYHVVMNKFARDFNAMYDLDLPAGTDEEQQLAAQEENECLRRVVGKIEPQNGLENGIIQAYYTR